jgi:ATP-dependent helicase HrpA
MAFELVQTTQLFARTAARIDPAWLDQVGHHLLKRSYSDPHWSEKSGRASVKEHATLFGLSVLKDHSVDYASIAPLEARRMFIEHALVRGEYKSRGLFQAHNRQLFEEIARLRDKARQSDMLADEGQLVDFFDAKVPDTVVNGKTFEAFREKAEKANPRLLYLSYKEILAQDEPLRPEDYPDKLVIHGTELALTYRFDPYAEDDGITVCIPLPFLPQLGNGELDFIIPAWQCDKLAMLIEQLPRAIKRELGDIRTLTKALAPRLRDCDGPLLPALASALSESTSIRVSEDAFRPDAIPAYLNYNCRILNSRGASIAESRDIRMLLRQHGAIARELLRTADTEARFNRKGIAAWDFGDLPQHVTRLVQGSEIRSYPSIVDKQTSVELTLFESADAAEMALRKGVARLLALALRGPLGLFGRRVPPPFPRRSALSVSRSEQDAFADALLLRVVEEAFYLTEATALPRNKSDFEKLLADGGSRLAPTFESTTRGLLAAVAEYDKLRHALDAAAKHPSGNQVGADIRAQLDLLVPPNLINDVELARIEHFPRYLKAAQARLSRALVDPRKDQLKAEPFLPLWKSYLTKSTLARDKVASRRLRWTFEELRVALFAPELRPRESVTIASVAAALNALR